MFSANQLAKFAGSKRITQASAGCGSRFEAYLLDQQTEQEGRMSAGRRTDRLNCTQIG
jgi:hypothetical protein